MDSEEMVTVPKETFARLLKDSAKLNALECAGVDNWGGYSFAMAILRQQEGEEDE